MFDIEYPIFAFRQARVAAVTNGGRFGILGTIRKAPEEEQFRDRVVPVTVEPVGDDGHGGNRVCARTPRWRGTGPSALGRQDDQLSIPEWVRRSCSSPAFRTFP